MTNPTMPHRRTPRPAPARGMFAVFGALVLLGSACSSGSDSDEPAFPPTTAAPTTAPDGSGPDDTGGTGEAVEPALAQLQVEVDAPMDLHATRGSLLLAERRGLVVELTPDGSGDYERAGTVIDLTDEVGDTSAEKGLLGVTTDPRAPACTSTTPGPGTAPP
ncbi:MAG: hypothetical protein R2716_06825 [Microthrixaceae bacterium]